MNSNVCAKGSRFSSILRSLNIVYLTHYGFLIKVSRMISRHCCAIHVQHSRRLVGAGQRMINDPAVR
jgi:hypothetical protein